MKDNDFYKKIFFRFLKENNAYENYFKFCNTKCFEKKIKELYKSYNIIDYTVLWRETDESFSYWQILQIKYISLLLTINFIERYMALKDLISDDVTDSKLKITDITIGFFDDRENKLKGYLSEIIYEYASFEHHNETEKDVISYYAKKWNIKRE